MIGLDTNVLARYYVADAADREATAQREAARKLIESGQPLMVSKTVVLEFEWVLRGFHEFTPPQVSEVLGHLVAMKHLTIEDRDAVTQAIEGVEAGLDLADALHHASYRSCEAVASFDDKKFVRRAKRMGLTPRVFVPQ